MKNYVLVLMYVFIVSSGILQADVPLTFNTKQNAILLQKPYLGAFLWKWTRTKLSLESFVSKLKLSKKSYERYRSELTKHGFVKFPEKGPLTFLFRDPHGGWSMGMDDRWRKGAKNAVKNLNNILPEKSGLKENIDRYVNGLRLSKKELNSFRTEVIAVFKKYMILSKENVKKDPDTADVWASFLSSRLTPQQSKRNDFFFGRIIDF